MAQTKTDLILKENLYRVLISLSVPIILNNLIQQAYNLVDGLWVSKISSVHFAATTFVWPMSFLFISLGSGLSVAGTSLLAQLLGGGQHQRARQYSAQLLTLSLLTSLVLAVLGYWATPWLVRLLGATGDLAALSILYLRITFWELPCVFFYYGISAILHAQGDTVTPMILSGLSAVLNSVLDPLFIFTFNWGLAGAAWATVLSRALLSGVALLWLLRGRGQLKPDFFGFRFQREIIGEIVRIGLPASIGQSGAALGFAVFNGFIAAYGTATLAAYGMVNRITSLVMQPATGVGHALTTVIGQNLGANQQSRVQEAFFKAVKLAVLIGGVGSLVLILFDEPIIHFFMQAKDDPAVISESLEYLLFVSVSMPLMGLFSVFNGLFQGAGSTKYAMNMEVGRLWFTRLPMIVFFGRFTNWGSTGIWFSMSFSNLIVCLYGYWVYRTKPWNRTAFDPKKEAGAKPLPVAK